MFAQEVILARLQGDEDKKGRLSRQMYPIGVVTSRAAADIAEKTGVDVSGFMHIIDGGHIGHVDRRHGKGIGVHDQLLETPEDVGKLKYVLDNYDSIELSLMSSTYKNRDGTSAKAVVYKKQINGTLYVAEAIPDTDSKLLRIITVFKNVEKHTDKNKIGGEQVPNMVELSTLRQTANTALAFTPANKNYGERVTDMVGLPTPQPTSETGLAFTPINENSEEQALNMVELSTPQPTSETAFAFTPTDNKILYPPEKVNTRIKKSATRSLILLILMIAAFAANVGALGVAITEIHRDPAAGNKNAVPGGYSHVFVELTNFGSDTFFLSDVFITNGKVVDSITLFSPPVPGHESCVFGAAYIPPGGTAVILPQNYRAALETAPSTIHPIAPGAVVLSASTRNMGGGIANDDGIALYKGTRARIDSLVDLAADPGVFVSAPLSGKIPLNPRQPKGSSVVPASLLLGGDRRYVVSPKEPLTPGRFDALQNGLYVEHTASMVSEMVRCSVAGIFVTEDSDNVPWRFYSRLPASGGSGAADIASGVLGRQRDFLLAFDIVPEERQYFFEVRLPARTVTFPIDLSSFWADKGSLLLTELYPKGGTAAAAQPEWFELQNVSSADINLNGWMFGNSKDTAVIVSADFILPPGEFLVVSRDTAALQRRYRPIRNLIRPARWHTLNSFNDTLAVWSPHGVEVDRAVYRSAWFGGWTAQSLERVIGAGSGSDQGSWALCERPTPGGPGGAGGWRAVSSPSIEIGPVPFSPNGDGVDDILSIRMKAPPGARATVRIFGFDGKPLKTFAGEREVFSWDGRTDGGRPAAPGAIYIVAEFTSGGARQIIKKRGILWR
jgi:hypothetical protein